MIDKRFIVLALLFVVAISISLTFSPATLSEKGYGELLGKASLLSGIDTILLKALAVAAAFLASTILFFGLCGWDKEYEEKNLLPSAFTAILLLLSPFVAENIVFVDSPSEAIALPLFILGAVVLFSEGNKRWLGIIPLLAGLALTYQYIQIPQMLDANIFAGFPILIALAFLGLGYYLSGDKKNGVNNELIALIAGLATLLLLKPLSLAFFALAAGMAMKKFVEEHGKTVLLTLVFALALFITITVVTPLTAIISAAAITAFAYIILSLYNFEVKGLMQYLMIALIAFSISSIYFKLASNPLAVADEYFVESLKYAKANGLNVAILEYPNTYQFYTQTQASVITGDSLLTQDAPTFQYLLISYRSLPHNLAKHPVAFLQYGTTIDKNGLQNKIYYSEKYALMITPNAEGKISTDGTLYSVNGAFVKTIPFTKLKLFSDATVTDSNSVVINIDGYEDTQLYDLLLTGETIFKNNGARIIKVA